MQNTDKNYTIAIDGHSGTGKSTVAKTIATKHGFLFIDTGAMYRSVTLLAKHNGFVEGKKVLDEQGVCSLLDSIIITFEFDPETEKNITFLNGENVEASIRTADVTRGVSAVSAIKAVRERLVWLQREMSKSQSVVLDGRDIGTVVFPHADLKIFMTASPEVRAQRRYDEMVKKDPSITYDSVFKELKDRDTQDQNRSVSPLVPAEDAVILDNSTMTREEQYAWIDEKIRQMYVK